MNDDKINEDAENLLGAFAENESSVERVVKDDPFQRLKMDLLSFFKSRIEDISSRETLKARIEEDFLQDVENGELSFQQKMSLYTSISNQSNKAADSLLSIFRPTPGAPSILAENLARQEDTTDSVDDLYNSLSSEDIQKLEKLTRLIQSMGEGDSE